MSKSKRKKLDQIELPEVSNPLIFLALVQYRTHKPPKVYYTRNLDALDRFVVIERATDETIASIDLAIVTKTIIGSEVE
jgi:hypothetical protein